MTDLFSLDGLRLPKSQLPRVAEGQRQLAVCPFAIAVDSREQLPYGFAGMTNQAGEPVVVPTVIKGLGSGDYSIDGFEDKIAVERKSLGDLYGSVTWGRERFEREIQRMDALGAWAGTFMCVVVEASWPAIVNPAAHRSGWENRTEPRSVEGTIVAWSMRYKNVHWWACGNRHGAECRTFSILRKFWGARQTGTNHDYDQDD